MSVARPWFPLAMLVLLSACGASEEGGREGDRTGPPNLVIVIADQLRYRSVGYAGDSVAYTPNIDQLAAEGVSFRNYVVSTPVCAATRATLLTGLYASSTGMVVNELRLNPNVETLATVLRDQGYATDFIGKWHLWANQAGHHEDPKNGFVPPGPYRLGFDDYWAAYNFNHQNYASYYFRDTMDRIDIEGSGPEHFTDLAIERITQHANRAEPFALVLALSQPHPPWTTENVDPRWYERFAEQPFQLPRTWSDTPDPRMDRFTDPDEWLTNWKPNLPESMRIYYAMTSSLDEQVGRLTRALEDSGIADETVLVFTSDHGEQLGSHGRIQKMIFYEESARVPLLIRWPGRIPAGLVDDATVASPDLMPTLLGLLGVDTPSAVEGMDLSLRARGEPGPEPAFAFLQGMGHTYEWLDGFEWRAVRDKRYTYAVYRSDGYQLLFDNVADPVQTTNLAGDPAHAETVARLDRALRERMAELGDTFEACSWYRDEWTDDRVIVRSAKGAFSGPL